MDEKEILSSLPISSSDLPPLKNAIDFFGTGLAPRIL